MCIPGGNMNNSKNAAFCTLGCKVNQYETEALEEMFLNDGYNIVPFSKKADVYIINTCSVTNMSDRKSRQMIRRARKQNSEAVIIVTGCYAQTADSEVVKMGDANLIIGTQGRENLLDIVKTLDCTSHINLVGDIMHNHKFEELKITKYTDRTRAFIKVQEGCNQFCSYCIIPYARGPIRSRDINEVLDEIRTLAKNGYKEIILVGIHIASYGLDTKNTSLEELLTEADKIEGIERIRISSIEPMTLNADFINKISVSKKLCRHFHISLQSGCDDTLKRMNRKYTTSQFMSIVQGLRNAFEDVAITTDIMVGFAGETDEEFAKTLNFVNKVQFADAHIFQYSQRRGTPADKYPNQVLPQIKEERSKKLLAICEKSRNEFLQSLIGKNTKVLFERKTKDNMTEGKTDNYVTVKIPYQDGLIGNIKKVKLKSIYEDIIIGELTE